MGKTIEVTRVGRVVLARLNNPPHSLMSDQMVAELDDLVTLADSDDGIGVVVITGAAPGVFLAHYDVSELLHAAKHSPAISEAQAGLALRVVGCLSKIPGIRQALANSSLAGILKLQRMHDVFLKMGRSGTIYIAAINGTTAGGGLELSLACDFRYIADDGELGQPEVLLGFPPGGGGTQRLSRLIGRARALEIMLSGRQIDPQEAKALGLVTDVLTHAQLVDEVVGIAHKLATRFKPAISVIKRATLEGGSLSLSEGLSREQAGFLAMLGTDGAKKAMEAYVTFTKKNDGLPATSEVARDQLQAGTFAPFYSD